MFSDPEAQRVVQPGEQHHGTLRGFSDPRQPVMLTAAERVQLARLCINAAATGEGDVRQADFLARVLVPNTNLSTLSSAEGVAVAMRQLEQHR
jgi:hypothetical protein